MRLNEALEVAQDSITPGAITNDLKSYVWEVEDTGRPYRYVPDLDSSKMETWQLQADQLNLVLFANNDCWIPTSNLVF